MGKRSSDKGRYNFLIDKDTYDDFSVICEEQGLVRSKKLENYMKQFINKHKKLLDQIRKYR